MAISEQTRVSVRLGGVIAGAILLVGAVWQGSTAWAEVENAIERNAETNARIVDLIESNEERRKEQTRAMDARVETLEEQDLKFLLLIDRLTRIEEAETER